jgi:2-oxoglutarate dehydrogenase E1 component
MLTLWVQEEPINMGAWRHIAHEFRNHEILPVCRQASGSPATGLLSIHRKTQEEIIQKVFRKCVCDRKLNIVVFNALTAATGKKSLNSTGILI